MHQTVSNQPVIPFGDLLDSLRRQGIAVGVDHYLRIYALLERVGDECSPQQLKTLICPLVATSREQQEQFYRVFDQHFGLFDEAVPPALAEDTDELPITTPLSAGAATPSTPRTASRRKLIIAGAVLLAAVLITAVILIVPRPASTRAPTITAIAAPTASAAAANARPSNTPESTRVTPSTLPSPAETEGSGPVVRPDAPSGRLGALREAPGFAFALLLVPLLGWVLFEWYRYRSRQLVLRRERHGRPPFSWPVRVPTARHPYGDASKLAEAARVVRTRQASESQRLAVDATIAATIDAHGAPTLRYRSDTRSPDYLMLIERMSAADHHAQLFADLGSSLVREGVHITRFDFDRDPRVCFSELEGVATLLVSLRHQFPVHRLLVFACGDGMIDPVSMTLHPWVESLMDWRDRVLLTPEPVSLWGMRERVLAKSFLVLPASIDGLRTAGEILMSPERSDGTGYWDSEHLLPLPRITPDNAVAELRQYLAEDAFEWLCACAIYPELNWELTLFIGSLPCMRAGLVTEENILRLIRLPWFRIGAIPDDIRFNLISALSPDVSRAVRSALVQLLEQHPPPADSAAAPRYQLNLVMQRLLSGGHDKRQHKDLARELQALPERELMQDRVYVRLLERDSHGPMAMLLPRRLRQSLHRGGTPMIGGRTSVRLGLAAASIMLTIPVSISWLGNRSLSDRVNNAARAVSALPALSASPGTIAFPSREALRTLDALRAQLDTVQGYVRNGPPLRLRFGLWQGPALLAAARPVWYEGFRRQLFATSWGAIVDSLKALPEAPTASNDYGTTYALLKTYLITTSAPERSTVEFVAPVLLSSWQHGLAIDADVTSLARRQFEFYASELPTYNPFPTAADNAVVTHGREFLARFTGGEQIYRNLLDAANTAVPAVKIPQAPGFLTATPQVAGSFSVKGAEFMADAFRNSDRYFQGETWVIGDAAASRGVDRASVIAALRTRYAEDYAKAWRGVIVSAMVASPSSVKDAASKLEVFGGNQSPILQVLRTVALNTIIDSDTRATFQPVHAVTPPEIVDKFVSEKNQPYQDGLLGLMGALNRVASLPPPAPNDTAATQAIVQAALLAGGDVTNARVAVKRVAQGFRLAPAAAPVANAVERLLTEPIKGAEAVLRTAGAMKVPTRTVVLPATEAAADSVAVLRLVNQYADALSAENFPAAVQLFPGMLTNVRVGYQDMFKIRTDLSVRYSVAAMELQKDEGTVTLNNVTDLTFPNKAKCRILSTDVMGVERAGGSWRISTLSTKQIGKSGC